MERVNGCTFIQEMKMAFQVLSLLRIQLSLCHCSHIQSRDLSTRKCGWIENGNAPETLYTVRPGLFRSGCNICTTLPKSFMRPLPYSNRNSSGRAYTQRHGRIYCLPPTLAFDPWNSHMVLFHIVCSQHSIFFHTCDEQCVWYYGN